MEFTDNTSTGLIFDLPKEQSSIIKVIGVGGGGCNAVTHMYNKGIEGVNFVLCNTDAQALEISPVPNKIQLGPRITEGLGAGSQPEIGRKATEESINEIREILEKNTKMIFLTAGLGGGTGTGGAPIIAELAKSMGILTVAIVTIPFSFEGSSKLSKAREGIKKLREHVDSILVISNDKIREIYGNLTFKDALSRADDILATAAKSISEIITKKGYMNVDFADVKTVLKDSGVALMGSAVAEGEDRALKAVNQALTSPLLNDNDIKGAKYILLNITSGTKEITFDEISIINERILEEAESNPELKMGHVIDEEIGESIAVTILATGFESKDFDEDTYRRTKVRILDEDKTPKKVYDLEEKQKPETSETRSPVQQPPKQIDEPITDKDNTDDTFHQEEKRFRFQSPDLFSSTAREKAPSIEKPGDPEFELIRKTETDTSEMSRSTDPRMEERKRKLKRLNYDLNNPGTIEELETEPAFVRRNIRVGEPPHSSESSISRYKVEEDEDGPSIRDNNSYLHDNVD